MWRVQKCRSINWGQLLVNISKNPKYIHPTVVLNIPSVNTDLSKPKISTNQPPTPTTSSRHSLQKRTEREFQLRQDSRVEPRGLLVLSVWSIKERQKQGKESQLVVIFDVGTTLRCGHHLQLWVVCAEYFWRYKAILVLNQKLYTEELATRCNPRGCVIR